MEIVFVLDLKSSALFEEVHGGYEGRTIATERSKLRPEKCRRQASRG